MNSLLVSLSAFLIVLAASVVGTFLDPACSPIT
jgi:hypothetical protein